MRPVEQGTPCDSATVKSGCCQCWYTVTIHRLKSRQQRHSLQTALYWVYSVIVFTCTPKSSRLQIITTESFRSTTVQYLLDCNKLEDLVIARMRTSEPTPRKELTNVQQNKPCCEPIFVGLTNDLVLRSKLASDLTIFWFFFIESSLEIPKENIIWIYLKITNHWNQLETPFTCNDVHMWLDAALSPLLPWTMILNSFINNKPKLYGIRARSLHFVTTRRNSESGLLPDSQGDAIKT